MKPTTQQQPTIKKKHCGMKNLMLTGLKEQKRSNKKFNYKQTKTLWKTWKKMNKKKITNNAN